MVRRKERPPAHSLVCENKGKWAASVLVCDDFYGPRELQAVLRSAHSSQYGEFEKGWYTSQLYWNWDYERDRYADLEQESQWVDGAHHAPMLVRKKLEMLTGERVTRHWGDR